MYDEKNTDCALYGTPECRLLNSASCLSCSVGKLQKNEQQEMKQGLGRLLENAPEEIIEPLYTSKECRLCRGGEKGAAECYALFDMAREDPEGDWSLNIGNKKLAAKTGFMLLPLQVACCKSCRSRYRVIEYLPSLITIALTFAALFALTVKSVYDRIYDVAAWLPIAAFIGCAVIAWGVGWLIRKALIKKYGRDTVLDMSELPEVKALEERGWKQVDKKSCGISKLVFANELRAEGVYTRVPEDTAEKETGETDTGEE